MTAVHREVAEVFVHTFDAGEPRVAVRQPRWPRSPSRSQNATLAPSATKRLTVASPIPDAPPVTAATLPSNLPMLATFHCIAKRGSTISPIHPAGHRLVGPAWVSDFNRLRKLQAS